MTRAQKIIRALLTPLSYLDMAAMAAGGLWVIGLSQWQSIGFGVSTLLLSPYVIPILLLPAGALAFFMNRHRQQGNVRGERTFFIASLLYMVFFLSLWCAGTFYLLTGGTGHPSALLWAGGTGLLSLTWWASGDRDNIFVSSLVEVAHLVVMALGLCFFMGWITAFWPALVLAATLFGAATLIQGALEHRQKASLTGL